MNKPALPPSHREEDSSEERPQGPNLTFLYTLIAIALLVAMGLAALIVRPFYLRR
jgi:hypothetical protein